MHRVAIVVSDGVVPSDFAAPLDLFGSVRLPSGEPAYDVRLCAAAPKIRTVGFNMELESRLDELAFADTVMIPGVYPVDSPVPAILLEAISGAAARGARIASICSGAFVLAATGLLDGLRATTHWLVAEELQKRHPDIQVDPNVLYVDNGQILTSAGAAAGLDLCLHMIKLDYGAAIAAHSARLAVMSLERRGGQAQFIVNDRIAHDHRSLGPVMEWMEKNLHRSLDLEEIAENARLSKRTLNRRFLEQVGYPPIQWLLRLRMRRAQHLLANTRNSIERIASQVGAGSPAVFRKHFRRIVGTSPQEYRRSWGSD
ncbi:MAG: helix-turn-helix domain-containing protein [Rhodospirillaceae bacterium]|nr:helix-turn-helix domain-containing protein [Rhodospirillaceae bacterium]MDD9996179.1 helix-turn-helix domain-containing protein [Rhodospirillaceae bacterium]